MSKVLDSKSPLSTRIAYGALQVEEGEESEEEVLSTPEQTTEPLPPVKQTKTALKKAKKAASEAKKRSKAEKQLNGDAHDTVAEPAVPAEEASPGSTLFNPLEVENVKEVEALSEHVNHVSTLEPEEAPANAPEEKAEPEPEVVPNHVEKPLPPPPPVIQAAAPPPQPVIANLKEPTQAAALPAVLPTVLPTVPVDKEQAKKRQNVITRTLWSLIMIGGFITLLLLGHAYMIILVLLCQTIVYREVTALFSLKNTKPETKDAERIRNKDPWSKTLNWYFFAVTNYFLYGESIIYYFKHVVFSDAQLLPFATNHRIISFTLYTIGFMGFVMSLKKGYLKQQFGLFCWVHMSLMLIVVSSHFIVNNILEGLIWFWVPASLVICNDIFAYLWGVTVGRTPLISLSPKKTVEGFVGALWTTLIFGVLWGTYFMGFQYMICPVRDLGVSAWDNVQCTPNLVFVWRDWTIWPPLAKTLTTFLGRPITTIPYAPYQFHLLFMSCFASLVAPFGGFFASGFKRAFDIKDFGHSIPGHGGMTDRMDCQFLMGVFTYVYYSSLIRDVRVTVGGVLQTIVSGLTLEEQLELITDLRRYLEGSGVKVPC